MALIYAASGTMSFDQFGELLRRLHPEGMSIFMLAGAGLLVVGIGFKLGVVPFHLWTPDVYQGAPAPVTAFVATVSKGAALALLLRIFPPIDIQAGGPLYTVFALIAAASMITGNLLALLQNNVKRILAYSSIAHLGYLLTAYLAGGSMGFAAVTFYLIAYFVTTLGAFGTVTVLSGPQNEAEHLDDYQGLFWRRPWLAGVFTAMLLSLGRNSLDGRIRRQVLSGAGRSGVRLVGPGDHSRDHQHHRFVLLPSHHSRNVRPPAGYESRRATTPFISARYTDTGDLDIAATLAGSGPGPRDRPDPGCDRLSDGSRGRELGYPIGGAKENHSPSGTLCNVIRNDTNGKRKFKVQVLGFWGQV